MVKGNVTVDLRGLDSLRDSIKNRVIRKAMNAALQPLTKEMKALMPRRTGALKASIGRKVKTYRSSQVTTGLVGARASYVKGKKRPVRYMHIVAAQIVRDFWNANHSRYKQLFMEAIEKYTAEEIAKHASK